MHFVVNVEEPHKSKRPLQCHNCQEFGHSRNRCHLSAICVICSGRHPSSECDKDKGDPSAKKCNNCGRNHTANYRGCQVYREFYERMNPRQRREQRIAKGDRKHQDIESLRDKLQKPEPIGPFDKTFAQILKKGLPDSGSHSQQSGDTMQLLILMQSNMNMLQNSIAEMMKRQIKLEETLISLQRAVNKLSSK